MTLSWWPGLTHGCLAFVGVVDCVTDAANSILQFVASQAANAKAARKQGRTLPAEATRFLQGDHASPAPIASLVDAEPLLIAGRSRLHGSLHIASPAILSLVNLPRTVFCHAKKVQARPTAYRVVPTAKQFAPLLPNTWSCRCQRLAPKSPRDRLGIFLDPDILAWHFEVAPTEKFIGNLFELRKNRRAKRCGACRSAPR